MKNTFQKQRLKNKGGKKGGYSVIIQGRKIEVVIISIIEVGQKKVTGEFVILL